MRNPQCNPGLRYVKRSASIDVTRNSNNACSEPAAQREPIARVTADGAYDGDPTYQTIAAHGDDIEW